MIGQKSEIDAFLTNQKSRNKVKSRFNFNRRLTFFMKPDAHSEMLPIFGALTTFHYFSLGLGLGLRLGLRSELGLRLGLGLGLLRVRLGLVRGRIGLVELVWKNAESG